jgi:hypothetical protein
MSANRTPHWPQGTLITGTNILDILFLLTPDAVPLLISSSAGDY